MIYSCASIILSTCLMNPETVCNHALVVILTEYSFCTDIYILYFEIALVLASLIPEGIFESYCTS